jgi:hypothetical protein
MKQGNLFGLSEHRTPRVIKVVGTSFNNDDGSSRQRILDKLARSRTSKVWLERDCNNQYDRNAIAVMSEFGQVGFIGKELAKEMTDFIRYEHLTPYICQWWVTEAYGTCGMRIRCKLKKISI